MYKEILSLAKKERSTRENVLKTQLTRDEIAEVAEKFVQYLSRAIRQ